MCLQSELTKLSAHLGDVVKLHNFTCYFATALNNAPVYSLKEEDCFLLSHILAFNIIKKQKQPMIFWDEVITEYSQEKFCSLESRLSLPSLSGAEVSGASGTI